MNVHLVLSANYLHFVATQQAHYLLPKKVMCRCTGHGDKRGSKGMMCTACIRLSLFVTQGFKNMPQPQCISFVCNGCKILYLPILLTKLAATRDNPYVIM